MAAKVCLRCDWSGTTTSSACPRCGAALFAPGGSAPKGAPKGAKVEGPEEDGGERSSRGWIATVLVVAVAAAAFVTIQFLTPSKPPPHARATGFQGYLVYAAPDQGEQRLWIWDLATGTVQAGPQIHATPTALVSTYAVGDTWIGLTVPTGIGTSAATVVRSADANADPVELGEGQLVAWPDGGAYVSILRSDARGGCREHLQVTTGSLQTRESVRSFVGNVCGHATGLLRDASSLYVTVQTAGTLSIDRIIGHRLSTILAGYEPLGVSATGDFLVRTPDGRAGMYYPGAGARAATMITLHGRPFHASRLLAWSTDSNIAYVLGSVGGVAGVYSVAVGPRPEPGPPSLIFGTRSRHVSATITSTNDLFLLTDGIVRYVHEGSPENALPAPTGAPAPSGPLLWVLSLPYSPSVTP